MAPTDVLGRHGSRDFSCAVVSPCGSSPLVRLVAQGAVSSDGDKDTGNARAVSLMIEEGARPCQPEPASKVLIHIGTASAALHNYLTI